MLSFNPHLAHRLGINAALLLAHLDPHPDWLRCTRAEWHAKFFFMHPFTIHRTLHRLECLGLLLICHLPIDNLDRAKSYKINREAVAALLTTAL